MVNPFLNVIYELLPEPHASLLTGILYGTRSTMPPDLYEALIITGTIHITALSGQNISILAGVISQVTLVFGRRVSMLTSLLGICAFVLLVGPEPTVIRASIMGSLSLIAIVFGRQVWSLLSLFLAAGIMILINGAWLTSISFQLSFLATLGIILMVKTTPKKPVTLVAELVHDLNLSLKTTLAAQLFTLPIAIYYFRRISLIAPLTNVLIGWAIAPVMVLGLLMSMGGSLIHFAGKVVSLGVWVLVSYIILVVKITAAFPFAALRL